MWSLMWCSSIKRNYIHLHFPFCDLVIDLSLKALYKQNKVLKEIYKMQLTVFLSFEIARLDSFSLCYSIPPTGDSGDVSFKLSGPNDVDHCKIIFIMPPTLKKLEGHIAFGLSVCLWVGGWVGASVNF